MSINAKALVCAASHSTVSGLFVQRARLSPKRIAVDDGTRRLDYQILERRSAQLAGVFKAHGVAAGDRVAILSENRIEYLETFLAAGRIGAIVACQNWRLAPPELGHCLALVEPKMLLVSPRHMQLLDRLREDEAALPEPLVFGERYESLLASSAAVELLADLDSESPLQ